MLSFVGKLCTQQVPSRTFTDVPQGDGRPGIWAWNNPHRTRVEPEFLFPGGGTFAAKQYSTRAFSTQAVDYTQPTHGGSDGL